MSPTRGRPCRIRVEIADADRKSQCSLDFWLSLHPSETARGAALRALARVLLDAPGLQMRADVCRGREPALWLPGPGSRLALWVDIGRPDPRRLRAAVSRAERVVAVAEDRGRERDRAVPAGRRSFELLLIPPAIVDAAAQSLENGATWRVERDGPRLALHTRAGSAEGLLRS